MANVTLLQTGCLKVNLAHDNPVLNMWFDAFRNLTKVNLGVSWGWCLSSKVSVTWYLWKRSRYPVCINEDSLFPFVLLTTLTPLRHPVGCRGWKGRPKSTYKHCSCSQNAFDFRSNRKARSLMNIGLYKRMLYMSKTSLSYQEAYSQNLLTIISLRLCHNEKLVQYLNRRSEKCMNHKLSAMMNLQSDVSEP